MLMKRGLFLVGIILLLAAPVASAGFFSDFFENLMDRSGSSITGHLSLSPTLLSSIQASANVTKTAAPIVKPAAAPPAIASTKSTARPTPSTTSLLSSGVKLAATKYAIAESAVSVPLKPAPANSPQYAVLTKAKLARGIINHKMFRISITSTNKDGTVNAKVEDNISDGAVRLIGDKYYKIGIDQEKGKVRFTPTTEPEAAASIASDSKSAPLMTTLTNRTVSTKQAVLPAFVGSKTTSAMPAIVKSPIPSTTPSNRTASTNKSSITATRTLTTTKTSTLLAGLIK